jgi:hypothetical protein
LSEPENEPPPASAAAELLGGLARVETLIAGARGHLRRNEAPASSVHSQKLGSIVEKAGDHAA